MDALSEMFPTLSPAVIQSAFTKVGGSIEDAIEVLLKISASESEPTAGQGVGRDLPLQTDPHAQNWPQQLYGQTGSYLSSGWSESTASPSYPAAPDSQYSYGYHRTYSGGFSVPEQGLSGYDSYHSGGNSAYGYGGQHAWAPEVPGVRQEVAVSTSLLDTPSSSGGSSLTSSPVHAPQGATASYSRVLHASPKRSPASPRKPSPLNQTKVSKPKKRLVIMRGLPGSGKSTLAREMKGKTGVICSTDDFFFQNGQYVYDPSKLSENHDKNKKKVQEAMEAGTTPVIVDNTNLSCREMEPYVSLSVQYGYSTEFREPSTWWRKKPHELARRNSHGVPEFKIRNMMDRFEKRVTVESVLASQTSFASSGSRRESKKDDVLSLPALLPSFQLQGQQQQYQQQQHYQEQQQPSPMTDTTLPVTNTDYQRQHLEEEGKDNDSMRLLKIIQGNTTATPDSVEEDGRHDPSSLNLTAGQSEPVDIYRFMYDPTNSTPSAVNLGESPHSLDSELLEIPSGVISSIGGNQMPVFGASTAQPSAEFHDKLEYRDIEPPNTGSNTADATLSDFSSDLSQNEPPLLLVSPQQQPDLPPPLEDDTLGDPTTFPVQSHSVPPLYLSAMSTAGGGRSTEVSNIRALHRAEPTTAGLGMGSLEPPQPAVEGEDNDRTITPQVVGGEETSFGGLVLGLADMSLSSAQVPYIEVGEDVLTESVAAGTAPTTTQSQSSDVLVFLHDCFPEQSEAFLLYCWECSLGDIDACMDLVLTSSFKDDEEEGETPGQYSAEDDITKMSHLPAPKSVVEVKHGSPPSRQSSSTSGTSSLGALLAEDGRHRSSPTPQALTDEEYARQLQAEFDKEIEPSSQSAVVPQPTVEQSVPQQPKQRRPAKEKGAEKLDDEYLVAEYGQDEGFVLRLPRLLAYKLQSMYGSVSQHTEGDDLSNEDLVVLLSEQVAKSLYGLWIKTLQAKQDEIAVQKDLQKQRKQDTSTAAGRQREAPSSPSPVHTRSPSKKQAQKRQRKRKYVPLAASLDKRSTGKQRGPRQGARSAREPSLVEIMDEQQAQEMGAEQYSAIVDEWLDTDRAAWLQVNELYRKHSNVPRDVIDRYLVQTGMSIDTVDCHLCDLSESTTVSVFKKSQNPKPAVVAKDRPDPYYDDSYSSRSTTSDDHGESSMYQEYGNPTYQDYRAEAQLQAQLRHEAFQKAAAAWRSNKKELASYYAAQGRKHSEQMKDANHRAAWHIYEKRNSYRKNSIDLHGLHVTEALSILEEELSLARGSHIEIITGQGSHSQGGVPRLKKAVLNHLNTKGLPYDIPSHNPGAIIVDLSSWRGRR